MSQLYLRVLVLTLALVACIRLWVLHVLETKLANEELWKEKKKRTTC